MALEAKVATDLPVTEHHSEPRPGQLRAILHLFTGSWINLLLLVAPLAVVAHFNHWPDVWVFVINFLVMMP
ncbi:hypothetical protein DYB34_006218, partial [Aphanomyces astaci]